MKRRTYLAVLAGGTSATLAGCSAVSGVFDSEPCDGESCDIGMTRTMFVPEEHTISVGDTVIWRNTSEADHTVTAFENSRFDEGAEYFASGGYDDYESADEAFWDSRGGRIGPRDTFEHTFEVAGSYSYACLPHLDADMTGTIHVEE